MHNVSNVVPSSSKVNFFLTWDVWFLALNLFSLRSKGVEEEDINRLKDYIKGDLRDFDF